jgi:cytoskeletal protein CcmA (bactofilin family)
MATVLGSTIVVDGEISGDETLVIRGSAKGQITLAADVEVESGAIVEASVEANSVVISGTVSGDISAHERVELRPECNVVGDLHAPRILIADGATFKGRVDMEG